MTLCGGALLGVRPLSAGLFRSAEVGWRSRGAALLSLIRLGDRALLVSRSDPAVAAVGAGIWRKQQLRHSLEWWVGVP